MFIALPENNRAIGPRTYNTRALSNRQIQIIQLLHLTNKEIGIKLGLTEKTISTHILDITLKLGTKNKIETALYWANNSQELLDSHADMKAGKERGFHKKQPLTELEKSILEHIHLPPIMIMEKVKISYEDLCFRLHGLKQKLNKSTIGEIIMWRERKKYEEKLQTMEALLLKAAR